MSARNAVVVALLFAAASSIRGNALSEAELIARLKANRGLYDKWDTKPSFRQLIGERKSDVSRNPVLFTTPASDPSHPPVEYPLSDHPRLQEAAKRSDLVVVGRVVQNTSALTTRAGFIFTDSEFVVEEVVAQSIANRAISPIPADNEITVTSPGGVVTIEGHHASSFLPNEAPLEKNHRYILFLRFIPQSHSYMRTDLEGYELSAGNPTALRKDMYNPFTKHTSPDLVSGLHSSVAKIIDSVGTQK